MTLVALNFIRASAAHIIDTQGEDFVTLQRAWYKRLEATGFKDIEAPRSKGGFYDLLKYPLRVNPSALSSQDTKRYYEYAEQFLHAHTFRDDTDREVWQLHAEGVPYRKIREEIPTLSVCKIFKKIKHYRRLMRDWVWQQELEYGRGEDPGGSDTDTASFVGTREAEEAEEFLLEA